MSLALLDVGVTIMTDQPNPTIRDQILLLSTERKAHAFDLSETFRVAIGRHESNDVQLHTRNVSNHHAEILNESDGLYIHDLRSTNGTFVNGDKVRRHRLTTGDRVRVGSHLMTVHLKSREIAWEGAAKMYAEGEFENGTRGRLIPPRFGSEQGRKTHPTERPTDLAAADLLKILTSGKRSTTVVARTEQQELRVFIDHGRIVHAESGNAKGEKAVYRLFRWDASYELCALPSSVPHTVSLPVDTLISDALKQAEETEHLLRALPPIDAKLRLKEDCSAPIADLSPAEIEIYQNLIRHQTLASVLEECPVADSKILTLSRQLLSKGFFDTSPSSEGLLEGTSVSLPRASRTH